ncbi:hypothetical protein C6A85_70445, partial [Mycobacterium sp. ITM-2017-0098]
LVVGDLVSDANFTRLCDMNLEDRRLWTISLGALGALAVIAAAGRCQRTDVARRDMRCCAAATTSPIANVGTQEPNAPVMVSNVVVGRSWVLNVRSCHADIA